LTQSSGGHYDYWDSRRPHSWRRGCRTASRLLLQGQIGNCRPAGRL
jgi:hypothetical protein